MRRCRQRIRGVARPRRERGRVGRLRRVRAYRRLFGRRARGQPRGCLPPLLLHLTRQFRLQCRRLLLLLLDLPRDVLLVSRVLVAYRERRRPVRHRIRLALAPLRRRLRLAKLGQILERRRGAALREHPRPLLDRHLSRALLCQGARDLARLERVLDILLLVAVERAHKVERLIARVRERVRQERERLLLRRDGLLHRRARERPLHLNPRELLAASPAARVLASPFFCTSIHGTCLPSTRAGPSGITGGGGFGPPRKSSWPIFFANSLRWSMFSPTPLLPPRAIPPPPLPPAATIANMVAAYREVAGADCIGLRHRRDRDGREQSEEHGKNLFTVSRQVEKPSHNSKTRRK